MYDGNPEETDFGLSQREVGVSECSRYQESTLLSRLLKEWQIVTSFSLDYTTSAFEIKRCARVIRVTPLSQLKYCSVISVTTETC